MTAERPFVDRPVVDREAAASTAATAADRFGLPAPRLLRHGMNSIYVCGDAVVRVGTSTAPAVASHELARWLLEAGIPTAQPLPGCAIDLQGFSVTGWKRIDATAVPIDWVSVGAVVRRVHLLDPADVPCRYPVADPTMFPWWQLEELLDDVSGDIDVVARDAIRAVVERHDGWQSAVRDGRVLCHGDVHPGNVVMSDAGPVLLDWDLLSFANPAWDHAMMTTYASRWGGEATAYARFAEGYGHSLADDPLTIAVGELRNVAATLMRVRAGRTDPGAAAEAARRLRSWRGETDEAWLAQ